jgi:hypothetical protein
MRFQTLVPFFSVLGICFCFFWGCQGNQPSAPSRPISLSVSIPPTQELKSSLLGATTNELLYRVDGPGMTPVKGIVSPISIASPYGSIDFNVNFTGGPGRVLSLQLNDASTHEPLAIGACGIVIGSSPVTNVIVEMGSVTRNCYTLTPPTGGYTIATYSFKTDVLSSGITTGFGQDFSYYTPSAMITAQPVTIMDAQGFATPLNTVAYLGNGDFVDYDFVPPDSSFTTDSYKAKDNQPMQVGDIFCIKLGTIPGGHAWIQPAFTGYAYVGQAPRFRYRVNSSLPYFAYEQTLADAASTCSGTW